MLLKRVLNVLNVLSVTVLFASRVQHDIDFLADCLVTCCCILNRVGPGLGSSHHTAVANSMPLAPQRLPRCTAA